MMIAEWHQDVRTTLTLDEDVASRLKAAALAMENGAALVATDRDFARFPKLRRLDPTAA